ncbi:MAG: STAS domain-containing protein [Chromatiaceae bacterium]|nr:STAS domain-containing protein [Gammaproteobacteria bacterium]MCP5317097.1 STAS domain-containing protein [Chromatiaceae bacterium]MCW5586422.1 STAS domain-containing protein [Chromatiales bacterium]MCP5434625.1 STAS domain-containing protein [Chromatiaceae bacterium]MCP5437972.1 STAS domain-containing protein [Chromatiaceae bacterium]
MSRIRVTEKDGKTTIIVTGDFTFEVNRDFRNAYQALPAGKPVTVDFSNSNYVDSAGLGMLIRLREHVGKDAKSVTLTGANATIKTIFEVANFGQIFRIA